jgi:flavorubredoxin
MIWTRGIAMSVLEIKENIFWVGAVDWELRDFHGYARAGKGTTYNAFIVRDEKISLFDTVNSRFKDEFLHNIENVVNPKDIEYLFVNHVEPDHSGCLVEIMERVRPEKIFCTAMGKQFMISHYHREDWPFEIVKTGDSVSLGQKTVRFIELKMLHWPDNLGCYLEQDQLFLSSDAFGHNLATSERFDDEIGFSQILEPLANYFANIILPYSDNVLKALNTIEEFGWNIDMIAPDHGLIFRSYSRDVLRTYRDFALQKAKPKAVIIYDTMWKSTEKMAHAIAEGLMQEGIIVRLFHMKSCHHSDVMAEVLDAQAVIMGSPTHNLGVLPYIAAMLRYMQGLKPKGKLGAAFGSYGWEKNSIQILVEGLEKMDMEIVGSYNVQNVPTETHLDECIEFGMNIAEAIRAKQAKIKD